MHNYEVYIMVADGMDDYTWDIADSFMTLSEATKYMASLEDKGYSTRLYDRKLDKSCNFSSHL